MKSLVLLCLLLPGSAFSADMEIPKAKFISEFSATAPAAFCESKTYFGQCFSITPKDCQAEAAKALSACLKDIEAKLPATFHQPADGREWGEKLGACMGEAIEGSFAKDKKDSPECKDESKWTVIHEGQKKD